MPPWNAAKAKGKIESARVKVEAIIHEDIHVELLELLELYCELLLARFGLLDQKEGAEWMGLDGKADDAVRESQIQESVKAYAVSYTQPRGRTSKVLRELLMHKYGREFSAAVMENRNGCVSDRVLKKLTIATPSGELVDGYLGEIARGYHVDWAPAPPPLRAVDGGEGGDGGDGGGEDDDNVGGGTSSAQRRRRDAASAQPPAIVDGATKTKETSRAAAADADADAVPRLPNLPPTEDEGEDEKGAIEEKEKLKPKPKPKDASANVYSSAYSPPPPMVQEPEDEDDFSALARRFEALKRR
ncbi:hypothetical protein SERLADRAFT_405023 [Serpula lacrymans var. lacrymans S7.9]|uniref:DUF292 domain-containing protein n=1 Tax=Serpula lacrymans var. lacrymans (strain S7.9) TaxID=578457 RepID=F8NEX6_SERL9|nr:uncharacterized protein SERLADRAFT_405023 [Serpula lacrymans var. lacrymans S7.9]EGO31124.1 hypothetical protein SERLADRAFT_405023 [Serpula lacrymans var. lacrymans S7.9]